ncbi:arsenite efflux transporter metallochaperone ArsD [Virgibacillus sp. NKC19-3]|uniref:arsenite efflux transporter metallochaperone ArsD n=1 Tax=Virgibacillus saliphilus TaxID=2831674 RepID=UPI001C9B2439|nr:arsenite efflux transporter metallochaperone ArsD [Virgibacillus sp. NKC19-3]MBY7141781.1 arsenite efflux transporter metallochaperone ArsD [Virgibacillus sp. NKC19-3]
MKKIEIFDPAMCCSTGVCGPSVDPDLTRIASVVYSLEQKNFDVTRYNLANDPGAFTENKKVNRMLHEKGADVLPIILLNNEIIKSGDYPTNEEFAKWLDVKESELQQKPKVSISLDFD